MSPSPRREDAYFWGRPVRARSGEGDEKHQVLLALALREAQVGGGAQLFSSAALSSGVVAEPGPAAIEPSAGEVEGHEESHAPIRSRG